jgi:5-hydroxyisourate hydrolase
MITTHVLDTSTGRPAAQIAVVLERDRGHATWEVVGRGETDGDGRLRTLVPTGAAIIPGIYRLTFDTRRYFDRARLTTFYPHIAIVFETLPGEAHYHVPLLLSPFGYTTYRGS